LQSFSADDLAYRAINRGFSILYSPALKSRHKTLDLSLTEEIFYARDNIIFVWKNLTDAKYIKQHILFLCLRILTLNLFYWFGFLKAFRLLKRIEKSRKTQAEKSVFSDSQIFEFFKNYFSAVVKR
jgi:GT2 family glycosyltransferase